jgi:hypothetical protein
MFRYRGFLTSFSCYPQNSDHRSQLPCDLKRVLCSAPWALGSQARIPLRVCVHVCVSSVLVLSCVGRALVTGRSRIQGVLLNVHKHDSEIGKRENLDCVCLSCHARRSRAFLFKEELCLKSGLAIRCTGFRRGFWSLQATETYIKHMHGNFLDMQFQQT